MKQHKLHNFVSGVVIMALLAALAAPAFATTGRKQLEVDYTDIHLHVDGVPVYLEARPFVSEGTTYLPVRAVGEALGMDVRWDGPTHTVYITDPTEPNTTTNSSTAYVDTSKKTIEVDYLDIKLVVNGKEVTPKDANGNVVEPFAYNGTTYLPVRAVGEALGKTVRWDGETKTVHLGELPQATYLVDVCKVDKEHASDLYRAADHKAFEQDGNWYSQGFLGRCIIFELGGKYESLTFDVFYNGSPYGKNLDVYLDGEVVQEIKTVGGGGWQTITVPLNYAQVIAFCAQSTYGGYFIANAVLNGERTVTKPVPPTNATYLVDACTNAEAYKYKAAEEEYWEDAFGNKYTNGIITGSKVQLNGRYKTLKATVVTNISTKYYARTYREQTPFVIYVDGKAVEGIKVSNATYPSTIEIPLNYGMELSFEGNADIEFLADAVLE